MTRGRKPKPLHEHLLAGNPSHKRLELSGPQYDPAPSEPPKALSTEARKLWRKLHPHLTANGLLTVADVESFSLLCATWASIQQCQQQLATDGLMLGGKRHPAAMQLKDLTQSWLKLAERFGLDPASRARLDSTQPVKDEDPLARYRQRGQSTA